MIDVKNAVIDGENLNYDDQTWEADFSIRAPDGQVYKFSMHELDFAEFVMKVAALHKQIQVAADGAGLGVPVSMVRTSEIHASQQQPACIGLTLHPDLGPVAGFLVSNDEAEKLAHQILGLLPKSRALASKLTN